MKLGAISALAADTSGAQRMTVINLETQLPLKAGDKECYVELLSVDSEVGRKLDRDKSLANVRKLRSGRNLVDEDADPIKQQVDDLAALTVGWYFGEDAEAFSPEAARTLYGDPAYAWLRRQVFVFVNDTANFMKSSSTTSVRSPSKSSAKVAV